MTLDVTPEDSAKIKLHCTIIIAGEDVIGGVHDMVESGIISSPPPDWVMVELWVNFVILSIFLGEEPTDRRDEQVQIEGPDQRQQG